MKSSSPIAEDIDMMQLHSLAERAVDGALDAAARGDRRILSSFAVRDFSGWELEVIVCCRRPHKETKGAA